MRPPLAVLAALVAHSCAVDSGEPTPPLQRLALRREEPGELPPPSSVVERLAVPPTPAAWGVSAGWRVDDADERRLVSLDGSDLRAAIPRPIAAGEVQRIAVRGNALAATTVEVALREGARSESLGTRKVFGKGGVPEIVFDVPWELYHEEWDGIELEARGVVPPFELTSVDLVSVPPRWILPVPEDGARPIEIGRDVRTGVGLIAGEPIETRFAVTRPDQRLTFAAGWISRPAPQDEDAVVRATLRGGGLERVVEVPLGSAVRWRARDEGLADFEGSDVVATFELSGADTLCALANVEVVRPAGRPPTVLLVTSDTHRGDHLGCLDGGVAVDTPCLDALAAEGVLFEDCWSNANNTLPSHATMFTGIHPRDTGVVVNFSKLENAAETLAEVYRDAGWATGAVVSVRHVTWRSGLCQGFDRVLETPPVAWPAGEAADAMLELIEAARDKPLFAWLHVFDAHYPYAPPEEALRRYYPGDRDPFDPELPEVDVVQSSLPKQLDGLRDAEFVKAQYRAEITYLDEELGRVFAHPRIAGGLVAVTADHGEVLEKDGSWCNHRTLYPDTLHVPLILAGPGVPRGVRTAAEVESLDLGRTLLDLSGMAEARFPGANLLDALHSDAGAPVRRFAIASHARSASVVAGEWFLVLHLRDHTSMLRRPRERHETELFHRREDRECLRDLAAEHPETTRELRKLLVRWLAAAHPARLAGLDGRDLDQLAALGYAVDESVDVGEGWIDPACECEHCGRYAGG